MASDQSTGCFASGISEAPPVASPRMLALIARRQTFCWSLALATTAAYFAFVLSIAYFPGLLGRQIANAAPSTWGIVAGLGLLLLPYLSVALYVHCANNVYDREMAAAESGGTA